MAARQRWILIATILGSAVVFLDGTIVNVALPRIGHDLPTRNLATLEAQTYVYNGYLLALSALLVLAGALSDAHGRRRMFALGLIGFGAASLLCGLAPSIEALIVFRIVQGAAGALLVPGSLALLRVNFEGPEAGRAFGLWAAGTSLTVLAGPFLGGLLVDILSWRAAFLINVPLVAFTIYVVQAHVPESRDPEAQPGLDWIGAALFALAVGGVSFGVIFGQARVWHSVTAWAALGTGFLAALLLPVWLTRARNPLVPPSLFASRNFTVVNLATLAIYGALYVNAYYAPLFLQGVIGYSAAAAGLSTLPAGVILVLLSPRAGRLSSEFGPRPFLVAGPLLMAVGALWLARLPPTSTPWHLDPSAPGTLLPPLSWLVDVLPGTIAVGAGAGLMVTPLTTALMGSVPEAHASVAAAFNNAISRVGPQLTGALIFVAVSAIFFALLGAEPAGVSPLNRPSDPHWLAPAHLASTSAFHAAMAICAGLLSLGALISLVGLRRPAHTNTRVSL